MNKKLRRFFDHTRPHEDLGAHLKSLLIAGALSLSLFLLIAPGLATTVCLLLIFLSFVFRALNLKLSRVLVYISAFVAIVTLRGSLGVSFFAKDMLPVIFSLLAVAQSFRLEKYSDGMLYILWLMSLNCATLLLNDSATVSLWAIFFLLINAAQFLRLHLRVFSLETLLVSLRSATVMILYSLPMLAIFAYTYHRSNQNPMRFGNNDGSVSGLSAELNPGSVSELSLRSRPAYRIVTDRPLPPFADAYWRAFTLTRSEGLKWSRTKNDDFGIFSGDISKGCQVKQKIYPQQTELKGVPVALESPRSILFLNENLIEVTSDVCNNDQIHPLNMGELEKFKKLNFHVSSRVRVLVELLKSRALESHRTFSEALTDYYIQNHFSYSLRPKQKGKQSVQPLDDFLFVDKDGYCEHYAAATASLIRLAGVPARVAVGFSGGTLNPFGNYWMISYADSHAWVETWENGHWNILDVVAALPHTPVHGNRMEEGTFWLRFDNAQFALQQIFAGKAGIFTFKDLTLDPWIAVVSLVILLSYFEIRRVRRPPEEKLKEAFKKYCASLEKIGLQRGRSEGLDDFRMRTERALIERGVELEKVKQFVSPLENYQLSRYGRMKFDRKNLVDLTKSLKKSKVPASAFR